MTSKEQRLWRALSDLHTLCLTAVAQWHPQVAHELVMREAQAALAIAGPDTEDDLLRTLHWPDGFNGKAWSATKEWLSYRRKIGKPVRTHVSLAKALKLFESLGEDAYCRAIDESIMNGWQGLFPPRDPKKPKGVGMSADELRKLGVRK